MNNKNNKGHQALRKGRVSLPHHFYHVTTTTHQRTPIFSSHTLASIACRHFENSARINDFHLLAWVLMPDHAHWLIQLNDHLNLSHTISMLKSHSARAIKKHHNYDAPVWAKSFHDHALRHDEDIQKVARYIIANPLRAGLVTHIGDYPFWNCIWL